MKNTNETKNDEIIVDLKILLNFKQEEKIIVENYLKTILNLKIEEKRGNKIYSVNSAKEKEQIEKLSKNEIESTLVWSIYIS